MKLAFLVQFFVLICVVAFSSNKLLKSEISLTLDDNCLTDPQILKFLDEYRSKNIEDLKVYPKKVGQDISKNMYNNPCKYGSDHHVLDKATFI